MSIVVAVKVNDGIVLAADSTVTISGNAPGQPVGVLKTYDYGRKLCHIKDFPIGTLCWGMSTLGSRTIESLISEFEFPLPSATSEEGEALSVGIITTRLRDFLQARYDAQFTQCSVENRPLLGLLVSGFSNGQYFPEQYLFEFPGNVEPQERRPAGQNGEPNLGVDWFGMSEAISRLLKGAEPQLAQVVSGRFGIPHAEAWTLLSQFEYPIAFEGMPLQDAIDLAVFLVRLTIGRHRFVIGPPLCGGEVDVAVITSGGFTWVYRKNWTLN